VFCRRIAEGIYQTPRSIQRQGNCRLLISAVVWSEIFTS